MTSGVLPSGPAPSSTGEGAASGKVERDRRTAGEQRETPRCVVRQERSSSRTPLAGPFDQGWTTEPHVVSESVIDYRVLAAQIRDSALLECRPGACCLRLVLTGTGFAAGWAALFMVGNSWVALVPAAFLAMMFTQVLFLGHDAGHQQGFRSRRANWAVGLVVGDLLTGLSFGWWVPKHNAHHAHPNQVGRDPDIGPCTDSPARADPSSQRHGLGRLAARWRTLLTLPLLLLEVGMHLSSGKALARRRDRAALVEWLLLGSHAALYLTVLFWLLSPVRAVLFMVVQQGMFGLYLRLSFAPNHKGMPIIEHDTQLPFVERQVLTSRNVRGGRFTTFMLGGLNYQIEHHPFPTTPRANLVRAQRIVKRFCVEHDLCYREDAFFASYREAFPFLRVSRPNRGSTLPSG